jgi:hypothetical protein
MLDLGFFFLVNCVMICSLAVSDPCLDGKKFTVEKNLNCLIAQCNILSLGLCEWRSSYRISLQPPKENIQYFKTWNFFIFYCGPFLLFGSGSTDPVWIRIRNTGFYTYREERFGVPLSRGIRDSKIRLFNKVVYLSWKDNNFLLQRMIPFSLSF